jgi:triacylglycerol lipase
MLDRCGWILARVARTHGRVGQPIRRIVAIVACLALANGCASISLPEMQSIGSRLTRSEVNFALLYEDALRARTAYASNAEIRSRYPATVRINTPRLTSVLYFLERNDGARTQYITVRGTIDQKNFSEDFDITVRQDRRIGVPVHSGFDAIASAIYLDIKAHLSRGHKTYLVGHSLGGAVAALLAIYLIEDGYDVARVVTFGQPRFVLAAGVQHLAFLPITRVVDANDIVPMLPPATLLHPRYGPYEHVGQEVILLDGSHYVLLSSHDANRIAIGEFWRSISFAKAVDHRIDKYVAQLALKGNGAVQVPYDQREFYISSRPVVGR